MKLNPQPTFLMPDMGAGSPPADLQNSNIRRRPRIRRVVADHHPIELLDGDPALDDLVEMVGTDAMTAFGQFVPGGFRMVELLGLIDDPADQLPQHIVDDLKPTVSVLPLVSTETKFVANALVAVALRGMGATISGPFEEPTFLRPADRHLLLETANKLHRLLKDAEVLDEETWWGEVPPVLLLIDDPDRVWDGTWPAPWEVAKIFLRRC